MDDLKIDAGFDDREIVPARMIEARVDAVFSALGDGFETATADALELTFEGIPGDRHGGYERASGGREPWYERGTRMRNERQLTIVCPQELQRVAQGMEIDQVNPRWIGANMLVSGIANLSMLPAGTLMFFEGGATVKIDGQNAPCKLAGGAIAKRYPGREGLDLLFPKVARRLRGLIGWVEKPGTVRPGAGVRIRIAEHWLYR